MSWNVGVSASHDNVVDKARMVFEEIYPEPAPGVKEQFDMAQAVLAEFVEEFAYDGMVSVSVSGHARQGELDANRLQLTFTQIIGNSAV